MIEESKEDVVKAIKLDPNNYELRSLDKEIKSREEEIR